MQAQIDAIRAKVAECIAIAERTYKITLPAVAVRFDLTGRAAGIAGCSMNRFTGQASNMYLRFNVKHMRLGGQTWEHLLNDTVPHEVAHTVCQAFPKLGKNHNDGWKRVCIALGGNGRRTYGEDDAPEAMAALRPYVYTTTVGQQVRVTKVIHSKIQQGQSYTYRDGKGSINRQCQYSYMTAPAVVAAKKPAVIHTPAAPVQRPAATKPTGSTSNAERIRARLALLKAEVGSAAAEQTVQWAVATLGMKIGLARTYVKNNWDRC